MSKGLNNKGLKNRFDKDLLQSVYAFHYTCLVCGENGADAFHHVLSPSSKQYIPGKHNSSILNACPIHNFRCHLYNPNLHKPEMERMLLKKIIKLLLKLGYKLKPIDIEFYQNYRDLYNSK